MSRHHTPSATIQNIIASLAAPPRLEALGPIAGRFIHALRLIALHERLGRDPVPELAARLGSVERPVLIVEDIIDTGYTLNKVREILSLREPKSLAICTLLDKPSRREVQVPVDWIGFAIPDEFVVGCGIDYAQKYRNLPFIGKVVPQE